MKEPIWINYRSPQEDEGDWEVAVTNSQDKFDCTTNGNHYLMKLSKIVLYEKWDIKKQKQDDI